jgi:5'-nucleotidase
MKLVLTNDDGVESPGIHALAAMCAALGHEVVVVAPNRDLSGTSAALGRIPFDQRLPIRPKALPAPADRIEAFALDGPPGLAALIACQGGLGDVPDLVLSGINAGPNTGHSMLHSGTVGAALTAANFGVSAVAVSLDVADPMPWSAVAPYVAEAIDIVSSSPRSTVLNLNVPAVPGARGLRWATLDRFGSFRVAVAERQEAWVQLEYRSTGAELDPDSDTALLAGGYATMTAIEGIAEIAHDRLGSGRERDRPVAELKEVPRSDTDAPAADDRPGLEGRRRALH